MTRLKGAFDLLLPARCLANACTTGPTLQTEASAAAHYIPKEDLSRRGFCSHGPQAGFAGCRALGHSRLLAGANGPSWLQPGGFAKLGFSSAAKPSFFEGLRLQAPSNPFAPRKPRPAVQKLVLYRGRGMLLFRFIVRAKVFQLMGFLACAVFASVVLTSSNPDPMDLAAVGALAIGCVATSYCIWYYSGRYVGEMSLLLPERRVVRFSVLDFWGNREDNDVPLERLVAPWRNRSVAEVRAQARQALMPVEVVGDRQYYISVPHGHVLQKEVLQKILYGAPPDETAPGSPVEAAPAAAGPRASSQSDRGASCTTVTAEPWTLESRVSTPRRGKADVSDHSSDSELPFTSR